MSRYDASTIHDMEQLICKVAQCIVDQDNGMDALASASWDEVRRWMEREPYIVNEASAGCDSPLKACHTCGKIERDPHWWSRGICPRCEG